MPLHVREHLRPLPGIADADIRVTLESDGRQLAGYAVVLRVFDGGGFRPVRLYDYVLAHGEHHMHRYNRRGDKQPPEVLVHPSVQAGFDSAISQIRASGSEMIESWRRQTG